MSLSLSCHSLLVLFAFFLRCVCGVLVEILALHQGKVRWRCRICRMCDQDSAHLSHWPKTVKLQWAMRGSSPVVPAPDSPKTLEPRKPLGSPADVEEGEPGPPAGKSKASSAKSLNTRRSSRNSETGVRLGGLQHSSEESDNESCQRLLRKLSAMKATWVLVTLGVIILCGALAGPVVCKESAKCTEDFLRDQDLRFYSALIAAALASVLLQELASVILTHQAASKAVELIPDIKDSLIPSMLLCLTFIVLLVENLTFVIGEVPWYVHAANLGREDLDGQPVYSVLYAEWVINVPILLILAGSISLGRPPSEVGQPLIITNVYIVLAWVAHFIPNVPLRYTIVAVLCWTWHIF